MKDLIIAALVFLVLLAITWAASMGVLWIIFLCFGRTFTLRLGTGIWLVYIIVFGALKATIKNRK